MGDAKRRALMTGQPLLDAARAEQLGTDPFAAAFDLIYGMVEAVFTKTGGINHELIGIDFEGGKPTGVNVLLVTHVDEVPRQRALMLERWPMVAHVFEAWEAPDDSMPAHVHPQRHDIVAVMLHTSDLELIRKLC